MIILHLLGGATLGHFMGYGLGGIELGLFLANALPLGPLIMGGGTSGSGGGWSGAELAAAMAATTDAPANAVGKWMQQS